MTAIYNNVYQNWDNISPQLHSENKSKRNAAIGEIAKDVLFDLMAGAAIGLAVAGYALGHYPLIATIGVVVGGVLLEFGVYCFSQHSSKPEEDTEAQVQARQEAQLQT